MVNVKFEKIHLLIFNISKAKYNMPLLYGYIVVKREWNKLKPDIIPLVAIKTRREREKYDPISPATSSIPPATAVSLQPHLLTK